MSDSSPTRTIFQVYSTQFCLVHHEKLGGEESREECWSKGNPPLSLESLNLQLNLTVKHKS